MVICMEQDADLHTAQLMPLPLTVSCFSKIQIGFTFLVPAHLGSPGKGPLNVCVCVCVCVCVRDPQTYDTHTHKTHKPMTHCKPMTSWVCLRSKIAFRHRQLPIGQKLAQCHEFAVCRGFPTCSVRDTRPSSRHF